MTFKPGQSGNPSGRPKASAEVARMIREQTNGGAELVEFALRVWRGEIDEMNTERSRTWAHDWLSDRGLGKAVESIEIGTLEVTPEQQAMVEALRLSPHERRERAVLLREAAATSKHDDTE